MRRLLGSWSVMAARTADCGPAHRVAQAPTRIASTRSSRFAEAKMREYHVPGVAIGILDNGVITTRGLGVTNVEDPLPVTDHTVFPIASISKTFAATMMMRLVEQGKLDLKAPVRKYLPDFKVRDEAVSRDVTIWNLLTHTRGMGGPGVRAGARRRHAAQLRGDRDARPDAGGARRAAAWSYNNAGFSVSGRVIEAVTGTSINRAMRDLVFTPLGLAHAGTTAGDFIVNRFAAGHVNRGDAPRGAAAAVLAVGERHRRRRRAVHHRSADLREVPSRRRHGRRTASGCCRRASLELMRTPQLHKQSTDDDDRPRRGTCATSVRCASPRTAARSAATSCCSRSCRSSNFAIGILTNSSNGWRLIQDVEREALTRVSRRDVREEPRDRASRPGRNAAERRAARDAAGSHAVCRPLSAADERRSTCASRAASWSCRRFRTAATRGR